MARIVVGSWMVRYPLGGNLSWGLQYILGLKDLGHDVYLVEKYAYDDSCYDPVKKVMSNDCTYGLKVVSDLLKRFGLENKWCYVEKGNIYHGLSQSQVQEIFATADVYIDFGAHHAWAEEAEKCGTRVWIEGDPGYTHFKLANNLAEGIPLPVYDHYYTNGKNVGREGNIIPSVGVTWKHFYSPVKTSLFENMPAPDNAPFSTVMNWKSYSPIVYNGVHYGHKDIEFEKIMRLPLLVDAKMEVAVSGSDVPCSQLAENGWSIRNAQDVTISFDSFRQYLYDAKAEFSICKNVYVETRSGWFSDKSAAYLACGRPVILQDTGFSDHLPVGEGLFAFTTIEEAKEAIEKVIKDYNHHSKKAVEIAKEFLEGEKVFKKLLEEIAL